MGFKEICVDDGDVVSTEQSWTLSRHTYADLSTVSPVIFLFLLKECYVCGKSSATRKFCALQHQVNLALHNSPRPAPAVFTVHCFYALPLLASYADGFSQIMLSALQKFLKDYADHADLFEAQDLVAQLFLDVVQGYVLHVESTVIMMLEVFNVKVVNISRALRGSRAKKLGFHDAEAFIKQYIYQKIECKSHMTAVSLLQQFGIHHYSGKSLLSRIIQDNKLKAAEKWASYMGKTKLYRLIEVYVKMNMFTEAQTIITRNNLQDEYPYILHKCKERDMKTQAEKGCWDAAEEMARNDPQLLEYLVYMAMEDGYYQKVDELCDRYSLEGFVKAKEPKLGFEGHYLRLHELFINEVIWVDGTDSLQTATSYIEACKVVGFDCEWMPNYIKDSKLNKVSIMQIASEKIVFVFDMIKLYDDAPDVLKTCLVRIFQSPRILKIGYNFKCDMYQLSQSYEKLANCFKHYEMLLDIQRVFNEPRGGLSGLVKKILGTGLNKTRQRSDWEQRPLTLPQLEYAALDAVVLVHLFHNIGNHFRSTRTHVSWKSHIASLIGDTKK